MVSHSLKKNYRCSGSLKQFYGGGPFIVSSDGSFIACACGDAINIVDSSDSSVKSTIEGESDTLTALALSPDNKLLFSAGHSRQIRVWDLETLKCIRSWKGHDGPVMGMACHASGGLLATAGADRKVLVWDVDGGFCTHYFKGHKGVVSSILFHPDANKNILFSGSDDATVRAWDLMAKNTEKKCLAVMEKHFSAVTSIAVSEDGWTLLSAGRDKVVNLWDLHDYSCKTTVATYEVLEAVTTVSSGTPFASLVASLGEKSKKKKNASQETHFITVGERGVVRIWKSEGSVCLYEQKSSDITVSSDDEESKRGFTAAAMLPSDRGLLCVTADQQFFIYSVVENEEESELVLSMRLKMEVEKSKSRHEGREERADNEGSPVRENRDGRRKEKDHRSKDKEKDYDREKNRDKEREREKDHRRDKEKERDRTRDKEGDIEKEISRGRDKEREKEKCRDRDRDSDREKAKERDRVKDKEREKGRDKHKDREKERDNEKEKEKEKSKEKSKEKEAVKNKDRSRVVERVSKKSLEDDDETEKNAERYEHYENKGPNEVGDNVSAASSGKEASALELENRILKMREERKKKTEEASDALSWVARSRKIEEKRNAEKQRAHQLSRIFEEQDNINQGENEDAEDGEHLSGVKVLHGLEKVVEGGAVILTLKDQSVLADGDVNNEIDMLENVEIGEQKRRNEAYEAAKKKKGIYDDKFNDDPGAEKKLLPQYDEPSTDDGIFLDAKGRFTGEAEKKLEELRKRIQGHTTNTFEDLNSSAKISSDYFSHEEMLRFKKPKKKKALRRKDKLDLNALEAEAVASGLGTEDLGSRKDGKRQTMKEEKERSDYEKRSNAYQTAIAKADEASRLLRMEQVQPIKREEDETMALADDADDLYKSLERARKLAFTKKEEAGLGPQAVAHLVASSTNQRTDDNRTTGAETQENTVVFTEMEEFVWGLHRDEDVRKPETEDVFMDEDEAPKAPEEVKEEQPDGWTEVKDTDMDAAEPPSDTNEITPDETIHEVAVGKGLSGALKLLKDRGTLKEKVEWGGRNMDKKKSKLVGIVDDEESKERFKDIRIERTDEFGRTLTPKEAFRLLSHKFHGKGPGKMKEEKRMKQYQEELKLKQMKNSDTPSLSVERMREAQAQLKSPYLVLTGNVKPGQTSDPQSGFATVEKDAPGSLTPMLGDKKVEHFLGIKRKSEPGNSNTPPKRPKY